MNSFVVVICRASVELLSKSFSSCSMFVMNNFSRHVRDRNTCVLDRVQDDSASSDERNVPFVVGEFVDSV